MRLVHFRYWVFLIKLLKNRVIMVVTYPQKIGGLLWIELEKHGLMDFSS